MDNAADVQSQRLYERVIVAWIVLRRMGMKRFVFFCCFVLAGWLLVEARTANTLFAAPKGQNSWNIGLRGILGYNYRLVAASGSTVLLVVDNRVLFFDVSDPAHPTQISSLHVPLVTDVYLSHD